jgi:hypothetical protein
MEPTTVKDNRLYAVAANLEMQTALFKNALEGISSNDAHNRLSTKANHIAWLAGSLVQQRYETVNMLTGNNDLKQQADDLFKDFQGIKDDVTYPSIEQYIADWEKITPVLQEQIANADAAKLGQKLEFPGMTMTVIEMLTFVIYREANHIGQIALWRRLLGYEPMKYM